MSIIAKKLLGDARATLPTLPERSFHLCVTSPPYHGQRSYLPAGHPLKHLEIGSEPTTEGYIEHLLEVFRGVRRVLRDDGTLWVNLGDRYTSGARRGYDKNSRSLTGQVSNHASAGVTRPADPDGLKEKELCLLPQRVAIAMQLDGWYLRSMCPWLKRNVMPESVEDRPATAIEYVLFFSKSPDYYYDRNAVTVAASGNTHPRASVFPHRSMRDLESNRRRRATNPKAALEIIGSKQNSSFAEATNQMVTRRNRRNSDWFMESWQGILGDEDLNPLAFVVNPKGTNLAHFATYPPMLVRPIILAGTSAKGCCPQCGVQAERIVKNGEPDREHQRACGGDMFGGYDGQATKDFDANHVQNASDVKRRILSGMVEKRTVGWNFPCGCGREAHLSPVPASVLDPFLGSGTTAEVCVELGRHCTGCEISEEFYKMSDARDAQTALSLL